MDQEVFEVVKRLTVEELGVTPAEVVPSAAFMDDLGASLDVLELVLALEEHFQISIPDEDISQVKTVETMVDYISRKRAKK